MAPTTEKCGNAKITYPDHCAYACWCDKKGCTWQVLCPSGTFVQGESKPLVGPGSGDEDDRRPPRASVRGEAQAVAKALEALWKRKVTVPKELRGTKLQKRGLTGTPEQVARKLGFTLAPKGAR